MNENFNKEEKRMYMFKKHIKNHLFEYILDFVGPILLTLLLLHLCKAESFVYGIMLSAMYSFVKLLYNLYYYKKEYIDLEIDK